MDERHAHAHTSTQFNEELQDLRARVLAMGQRVEQQVVDATAALMRLDAALAREVSDRDRGVNEAERAIDEECSRILALRQPTAGDLRLVYSIIKATTDLERIGDEARKIARTARELTLLGGLHAPFREIERLSARVAGMVRASLDAFARLDVEGALSVARQDREVDREYEALMRQCITFMMEDPRTIRRVLDIIWAVRALERIGDHAKNIAQYVIYLVKGKDVRHRSVESIEGEIEG